MHDFRILDDMSYIDNPSRSWLSEQWDARTQETAALIVGGTAYLEQIFAFTASNERIMGVQDEYLLLPLTLFSLFMAGKAMERRAREENAAITVQPAP